jgi:hypothetical protein
MIVKKELPSLKALIGKAISSAQQEMVLTLPNRLMLAFTARAHEKDIDPESGQPFTSFYRWLWVNPPPGCGLCSSEYLDAEDIIRQLERSRDRQAEEDRAGINALIEDLVKGNGASKGKGGRPKKGNSENLSSTAHVNGRGAARSKKTSTIAARLAESADPKVRAAWEGHVSGKYRSVTAAAIACGMIEDANAPLARLKQNWKKASKKERQAFLDWIKEEGR